jgi:predicted Fe-S protein YdhL (DUF1289 family)
MSLQFSNYPPSPCTGVCRIDPATRYCNGCLRTLGEIADWSMLSSREKQAILDLLPARIQL